MTEGTSTDGAAEEAATGDADASLPDRDVTRAVGTVLPDATVVDVRPADHGKNAVHFVTVEEPGRTEPRTVVVKVGTRFGGDAFLREPALLSLVAERTSIPVPTVYGTDDGDVLGDPFFAAEAIPGETMAFSPDGLVPSAFERVCHEAGRNLAALHDAFDVAGFGPLTPGDDGGASDLALDREFANWPALFEAWLGQQVERLADTRFDDCVPALESFTERATERLSGALEPEAGFEPVVNHGDYRLGNLRVDAAAVTTDRGEPTDEWGDGETTDEWGDGETTDEWGDGETTDEWDGDVTNGVLDWETPIAATAEYELAVTEAILVDWPWVDDERDRRLRERLYEGYRAVRDLHRDEAFEKRRRLYRVAGRVRLMRHVEEEMMGRSEAAVDDRAAEHRAFLADAGVL
ncbi:phosphotransferase family protein [Halomicrococcus gelatinilyticus]|uniref:phosphotransferase family protein n=1 Tax=Halomicrococcus gelatinilyticus TaxID=1702103 RepID=UPI002E0D5B21